MKIEEFEKSFFNECVAKYKLIPTIKENLQSGTCSICKTQLIAMRLDRSPNQVSGGTIPSKDVFIFYGCPNCYHVTYAESDLSQYARKECSLKDYLLEKPSKMKHQPS
jgi:hypothetical protein